MSLYHHFRNKDEIVTGAAELALQHVGTQALFMKTGRRGCCDGFASVRPRSAPTNRAAGSKSTEPCLVGSNRKCTSGPDMAVNVGAHGS